MNTLQLYFKLTLHLLTGYKIYPGHGIFLKNSSLYRLTILPIFCLFTEVPLT